MGNAGRSSIDITADDSQARRTYRQFFDFIEDSGRRTQRRMRDFNPMEGIERGMRSFSPSEILNQEINRMENRLSRFSPERQMEYQMRSMARSVARPILNLPEHLRPFRNDLIRTRFEIQRMGMVGTESLDQLADAAIRSQVPLNRMMSATSSGKAAAKAIQELGDTTKTTQLAIMGLSRDGKVRVSTEEAQQQMRRFNEHVRETRQRLEQLRDAGDMASYNEGMRQLERQMREVDRAMQAAARGGTAYTSMLEQLGIHTANTANRTAIAMERMRGSFMRSIDHMNAMKTQSQRMMDALGDTSHIQRIDRAFLQVGDRLERMARQGTAANIALRQLGPNASMKDLMDRVRLINTGLMRTQQLAIVAGIALVGFTAVMAKASFGPSPADVRKQQAEIKAEYDKAYQQRLDQIYNFADMFKKVERQTFDKKELIKNLKDQAAYMETWVTDLSKLADRAPKAFVQELRKMGPEAAGEVHTLTKMTEKELNEYVKAWEHKVYMANVAVKDELEDMRKAAEAQIKELQNSLKPLGIAWERFIATWGKAAEPFVETWGQIAAKILDIGTAFGELIIKLNELNPSISAAAGNFAYLVTVMTLLLSPMAIGIGRAEGMRAAFNALWMVISPMALGFLRIVGMASLISGAIVIIVGSLMKMWDASEKLRDSVTNGWDAITSAFSEGFNSVKGDSEETVSVWRQMGDALAGVVDFMVMCIKPFAEIFGGMVASIIEGTKKISGSFSQVPQGAQHYQDLKDKAILHMMELRTKTGEEAEQAKQKTIQAFQEMTNEVIKELDGKKGKFEVMFAQLMGVVPESAKKTLETVKNKIVDSINKQIEAARTANQVLMEGIQKYQGDVSKMPKDFAEQYRQAMAVADNNIKLFYDKASQLTGLAQSITKGGMLSVEAGKKKMTDIMTTFKDGVDALTKQTDEMREQLEKEVKLGNVDASGRKAALDAIDLYEKKHVMDLIGVRNEGTKALENNLKAEDAALVLANPRKKELEKAAWYEKYKELLFGAETYGEAMSRFNSEQEKAEKSHKDALANYEKQYGRDKIENLNQYTAELSKGTKSSIMLAETMAREIDGKMKIDLGPAGTFTVQSFVDKLKSGELQANDVAVANANKLKEVYKVDLSESGIASMQTFTQAMVGKDTSEIKQALGVKLSNDTNIDLGIYGQMTIGTWMQGLQNGTLSFDTVFQYFQQQVKNGVKVDATAEGQANMQTLVNGMNAGAISVTQAAQLIGLDIKSNAKVDLGAEGTFTVESLILGMQSKQIDAQTAATIIKELIANGAKLDATPIGSDISATLGNGLISNKSPQTAANQTKSDVQGILGSTSDGGGGAKGGTELGEGIMSKRGYIKGSALDVIAAAQEGMNTIDGNPAGQKGGNTFSVGLVGMKGNAQTAGSNVAQGGKSGMDGVSGWEGIGSRQGKEYGGGIDSSMSGVKSIASGWIEKIKKLFDFSLKLPDIQLGKLPRIPQPRISGSFSLTPPSVPSIEWHKYGGFFDSARIIGIGEAGPEAAVPLVGRRMDPFADAVFNRFAKNFGSAFNSHAPISNNTDIAERILVTAKLYVDGEEMTMRLDPHINRLQGNQYNESLYLQGRSR